MMSRAYVSSGCRVCVEHHWSYSLVGRRGLPCTPGNRFLIGDFSSETIRRKGLVMLTSWQNVPRINSIFEIYPSDYCR